MRCKSASFRRPAWPSLSGRLPVLSGPIFVVHDSAFNMQNTVRAFATISALLMFPAREAATYCGFATRASQRQSDQSPRPWTHAEIVRRCHTLAYGMVVQALCMAPHNSRSVRIGRSGLQAANLTALLAPRDGTAANDSTTYRP